MCSTPFGITEVGIGSYPKARRRWRVLNAFRHHRGGHKIASTARMSDSRAQRLSASQRWASRLARTSGLLRHVLNAFRHHRGGHIPSPDDDPGDVECSTPFGITEVGIWLTMLLAYLSRVLNAFRHHRGGHLAGGWPCLLSHWCSTPFGITEVGIIALMPQGSNEECAQRLSASQRWASALVARAACSSGVLNAFRHHRGGHKRARVGSSVLMLCSTPFGITEVGIAW